VNGPGRIAGHVAGQIYRKIHEYGIYASVEQALHGRLGMVGDLFGEASRSEPGDRVGGDHVGGHGQDEADYAAEEAAQSGDDEHDQRVDGKCVAHDLGLDEVLEHEVPDRVVPQ
jgi:hypothetical protein